MGHETRSFIIPDGLWAAIQGSYPLLENSARDMFESHVAVLRSMNVEDRGRTSPSEAKSELLVLQNKVRRVVEAVSGLSDVAHRAMIAPLDADDHGFLQRLSENYLIDDISHLGKSLKGGPQYAYNASVLSLGSLAMLIDRAVMRMPHISVPRRTHCYAENLYRFIEGIDRIICAQTGGLHIKRGNGVDNEEVPGWLLELCQLGQADDVVFGAASVARALKYVILHRYAREAGGRVRREKIEKFTTD